MVDFEKLLVAFVRALGYSAYTELPEDPDRPVVRVNLLGGLPSTSDNPVWLGRATLQVDVWAETKSGAHDAMKAIRTALLEAPRDASVQDEGEISFVSAEWPAELPDSDWPDPNGRPGPRYTMTVRVTAHPTRS